MVRAQEHEKFSDPTLLQSVIDDLEKDKPITKKAACDILNMSYNTARLAKIIEEYKDKAIRHKRRRAEMRSIPVSDLEKKTIIDSYLGGDALAEISSNSFRSVSVIKNILYSYNIPLRTASSTYQNPVFLPDDSIANDYVLDDLVYSAKYNCPAYIRKRIEDGVYSMWLVGSYARQVVQPYFELADLRVAQKALGIEINGLATEEYNRIIAEAQRNAKKRAKK